MPVAHIYSTFFTALLIHKRGLWNGNHTISNAAREFLIRVIVYPCLLHRILTPYLDHALPEEDETKQLTRRVDTSQPSEAEANDQLQRACEQFLSSLEITDEELIDAIRSMPGIPNHNHPLNSWLCNRPTIDVFTKKAKPVETIMERSIVCTGFHPTSISAYPN